jgi:hypothetical protein
VRGSKIRKLALVLLLISLSRVSALAFEVELQWSICEANELAALNKLGYDEAEVPDIRGLSFRDSNSLQYFKKGVIFRILEDSKKNKMTIKLKFGDPSEVNWSAVKKVDHVCEWDRYLSSRKFTCNLFHKSIESKKFTKGQVAALNDIMGLDASFQSINSLPLWGPIEVKRWELEGENPYSFTLESIPIDDGNFQMELSTRVDEEDEDAEMGRITAFLLRKGLKLCEAQGGRTGELLNRLANSSPRRPLN